MKTKNLSYKIKPPCPRCPYKLGLVHALVNPCSACRADGYRTFERLQRELMKGPGDAAED